MKRYLQTCGYFIGGLALIASFWSTTSIEAAVYYVASDGSDSNPGTIEQPFQTIHRGASVLGPGDTVYVRAGTYAEEFFYNIPSGTSWSDVVRIAAYPGETVTVQPYPGAGAVFTFASGQQYIEIDGFIMDAINVSNAAVKFGDEGIPHYIRIKNSEVKNSPSMGILGGRGAEFINLDVHHNEYGLYLGMEGNLVQDCRIYDNRGYGIHVYNTPGGADRNTITGSRIYNNVRAGVLISSGSGNTVCDNVVEGNFLGIHVDYGAIDTLVCDNEVSANIEAGIYIGSGSFNATVEGNNIFGNGGPIIIDYGVGTITIP